jgi:hypothetical protein
LTPQIQSADMEVFAISFARFWTFALDSFTVEIWVGSSRPLIWQIL